MLARLSPGLSATVQRLADPVIVRAVPFFRTAAERFIGECLQKLQLQLYASGELIICEGHVRREIPKRAAWRLPRIALTRRPQFAYE